MRIILKITIIMATLKLKGKLHAARVRSSQGEVHKKKERYILLRGLAREDANDIDKLKRLSCGLQGQSVHLQGKQGNTLPNVLVFNHFISNETKNIDNNTIILILINVISP